MKVISHKKPIGMLNEESRAVGKHILIEPLGFLALGEMGIRTPREDYVPGTVVKGSLYTSDDDVLGHFTLMIKGTADRRDGGNGYYAVYTTAIYGADGTPMRGADSFRRNSAYPIKLPISNIETSNPISWMFTQFEQALLGITFFNRHSFVDTPHKCAWIDIDSVYLGKSRVDERDWPSWVKDYMRAAIADWKRWRSREMSYKKRDWEDKFAAILGDGSDHEISGWASGLYTMRFDDGEGGSREKSVDVGKIDWTAYAEPCRNGIVLTLSSGGAQCYEDDCEFNECLGDDMPFRIGVPVSVRELEDRIVEMYMYYTDLESVDVRIDKIDGKDVKNL